MVLTTAVTTEPEPTALSRLRWADRHLLASAWSRRISEEHRLVYLVDGEDIVIIQARFLYT